MENISMVNLQYIKSKRPTSENIFYGKQILMGEEIMPKAEHVQGIYFDTKFIKKRTFLDKITEEDTSELIYFTYLLRYEYDKN